MESFLEPLDKYFEALKNNAVSAAVDTEAGGKTTSSNSMEDENDDEKDEGDNEEEEKEDEDGDEQVSKSRRLNDDVNGSGALGQQE